MNPITVTQLTTRIVELFESSADLRDVWVTGEVSNWKRAASGHIYFRLKDGGATINAVMWKGQALAQSWLPRDGDQVLAHGYVGVYPEGGAYQLYANILRPAGRGQLYALYEQLKERLEAEGLFAPERKRPIPDQPRRLGIVTSADAAALRDILRTLNARWPLAEVVIFHTLVQGGEAPAQIAAAIALANRCHAEYAPLDAIILARGGGSIEDLWAFNDERVAYAIFNSALPIISGVGHETDTTIADFVADLRAPTPTGAAVAATPDRRELIDYFQSLQAGLVQQALNLVDQEQRHLGQRVARLQHFHPRRRLDVQWQTLDDRTRRLHNAVGRRLERLVDRRAAAERRLEALNPSRVLQRGYSIVLTEAGAVVLGPGDAPAGAHLQVRAARGAYSVIKDG